MHCIAIPEADIKRYIPSDLSQCDKAQYIDMCELIFHFQNQNINYEEMRTHAVYKLMNMKHQKSPFGIGDDEKFANVSRLADLIDSFFEENEEKQKVIKQYYIHNPVPSFKPLWKNYYGPTDSFMNMTFGEYTDGLRLFHDFHATGEVKLLQLLAALFYRKKKSFHFIRKRFEGYDGDIREPYNSHSLEKRATVFNYAPIGFVYGFYLLFASFQKYLTDAKIMWSGQELDFSILFDTSGGGDALTDLPGIGMDSIAFTMAESGAFGSLEHVRNTNFWQIMVRMYDMRRADLERLKQEKDASNK